FSLLSRPPCSTLFPYTTLFRSEDRRKIGDVPGFVTLRAGIITVSTRGAAGERADESGPAMRERLVAVGAEVVHESLVPDDVERRSEEHTSELQSRFDLVCRLLL